jgi:hypothetical protein
MMCKSLGTLAAILLCVGVAATAASADPPTISAEGATENGVSAARGHAKVTTGGKETYFHFDVISAVLYDENEANSLDPFAGAIQTGFGSLEAGAAAETEVSPVLEGLTSDTEYHLRFVASNEDSGGELYSPAPNFATGAAVEPTVTIDAATGVSFTKANVFGAIDPEGGNENPTSSGATAIGWEVQISTTPGENFSAAASGSIEGTDAEADDPVSVQADLEGLDDNTTYHYRLVAYYTGQQVISGEGSFTTDLVAEPTVSVDPASSVTGTTVHFSGEVTAGGTDPAFNAGCFFDYVADEQFQVDGFASAQSIECDPPLVEGVTPTDVQADPTGLTPHTVYHLRLRAENEGGQETDEAASTFETEAIAPSLEGTSVSDVTADGATLHAMVNPGGASTTYHFEYLTLAEFEAAGESFAGATKTAESAPIGSDATFHHAEALIEGLAEDTPYRFRVVAANEKSSAGGTPGPFRALRTAAVPASSADPCPNAAIRAQQKSQFLPDCRAYELVNPPGKDFGDVMRMASGGDDGEWTGFTTMVAGDEALGAQVGSNMLSHRTPTGWEIIDSNAAIDPFLGSGSVAGTIPVMYSADHTRLVVTTPFFLSPEDVSGAEDAYLVNVGKGSTEMVSDGTIDNGFGEVRILGASSDLSRVAFYTSRQLLPEAIPSPVYRQLYVFENGSLSLASVLPDGSPTDALAAAEIISNGFGGEEEGVGAAAPHGGRHAASTDAKRLYFYSTPFVEGHPLIEAPALYVRDLTSTPARTVAVTVSEQTGDAEAPRTGAFIAASPDGSTAYFASRSQLTDEGSPGGGIYRFDLDAPSGSRLTQVTPATPAGADFGLSTAVLSPDQSRLYFTSPSKLLPEATEDASNAYVLDLATDTTRIIGSFDQTARALRVSANGRYALLRSAGSVDGAPNNGFEAIYEYDDVSGELACASCRPDGALTQDHSYLAANPNAPLPLQITQTRNVADDGTVFFVSDDGIIAGDQNDEADVYQYRDGKVSLLSTGHSDRPSYLADNSDDGTTAFIFTADPLVATDRDANELDGYAVRSGGGFPEPPPPAAECQGEACRGPVSTKPAGAEAASATLVGPGNRKPRCKKGKVRRHGKCVKRKHRKRTASHKGRTGR